MSRRKQDRIIVAREAGKSDVELSTDGTDISCMACLLSPARTEFATADSDSGWEVMAIHLERHMLAGHDVPEGFVISPLPPPVKVRSENT